jgi:anthranilate synthase component 2
MILLLDNYDSFTYNLYQYLSELGDEVLVKRNDELSVGEVAALKPEKIVISPGPCTPNEAGISVPLIRELGDQFPILGVCLGHQSIGHATGADVVRAGRLMHGKTDMIHHDGQGLFAGLPNPFRATRYHSLIIRPGTLSDDYEITAWSEAPDGTQEIMGVRHKRFPLEGVQFHPESFLTDCGVEILKRFLEMKVAAPAKALG